MYRVGVHLHYVVENQFLEHSQFLNIEFQQNRTQTENNKNKRNLPMGLASGSTVPADPEYFVATGSTWFGCSWP